MALVDHSRHTGPVVGTIPRERGHRPRDLVEQRPDLGGIVNRAVGQDGGHDLATGCLHTDVQGSPGSAPLGAVLLDQPLARPTQLQTGAVDQQATSRWSGPLVACDRIGSATVLARRPRVEWSGTGRVKSAEVKDGA